MLRGIEQYERRVSNNESIIQIMHITDCDYVQDSKGDLHIVQGYWHTNGVRCVRVYERDDHSDRATTTGIRYKKVIAPTDNGMTITDVVKTFHARSFFQQQYNRLPPLWKKIPNALIDVGIPPQDIGIFGSYLLGFPIEKDVDFIVYGVANRHNVWNNIDRIRQLVGATAISPSHIQKHVEAKARQFNNDSSWETIISRKWSALQVAPNICSTIRFAYDDNEIPTNPFIAPIIGESTIDGIVSNAYRSDMHPRQFMVQTDDCSTLVSTWYWIYQSCVRDGDRVKIQGNIREDGGMTIDGMTHGIDIVPRHDY